MEHKKHFGKIIASLLLFVALMLPTAIQFFHVLEGHNQIDCNEQTAHVHKSIEKCGLLDFHLLSFSYEIVKYPDLFLPNIPEKTDANFASLRFNSFTLTNTQLRAPPVFS